MKTCFHTPSTKREVSARVPFLTLALTIAVGVWASAPAFGEEPPAAPKKPEFHSLDDLRQAFSRGLIPDPNSEAQLKAFGVYLKIGFGDPKTDLPGNLVQQMAQELIKNPGLIQATPQFRNYSLTTRDRNFPVTDDLKRFLSPQVDSAQKNLGRLFQIEANQGDWQKILGFQGNQDAWQLFLDQHVSADLREKLKDKGLSARKKAELLYPILQAERDRLRGLGRKTRSITQAMIDLLHSVGFDDRSIAADLKSDDGMKRIEAYKKALDARDVLSMELESGKHFDEAKKDIGRIDQVTVPTGVTDPRGISARVIQLETQVRSQSTLADTSTTRTIRHLSLFESPFRSCLGGSDCSSRTYPKKALDPNYHYFTLTNDQGESTGQVTVVLGEGKIAGKTAKVAFLDKVQNVSHAVLPSLLEGVRRAALEKGYQLVVPDDVGDHNGISNEETTRLFVAGEIQPHTGQEVTDFKPHGHEYRFPNRFSRAGEELPSNVLSALTLPEGTVLRSGRIDQPWRTQDSSLDLEKIVQESWKLKDSSNPQDRLKYLQSQGLIRDFKFQVDPKLDETLKLWVKDEKQAPQVRKAAVLFEWENKVDQSLHDLLDQLPEGQRIELVDQIVQTQKLRKRLLEELGKSPNHLQYGKIKASDLILKSLSDEDDLMGFTATKALEKYQGSDAFQLFEKALKAPVPRVRLSAALALRGYTGSGAVHIFEMALKHTDPDVVEFAAESLRNYEGPDAVKVFEMALKHSDPRVRDAGKKARSRYRERREGDSVEAFVNCAERN